MSRGQSRANSSVCADCSAPDPSWASINRGVLVCEECCSIHRSLGRHVSQIKSLRKGSWSPTQLMTVQQLVNTGANNIWEHSLLDPAQNKQRNRKPNPRDPVHPTKADFIRAKYQYLSFVNKSKDMEIGSYDDLNQQLHSSVRTASVDVSLRLLSQGADPNYFHPEKGNMPLHVAALCGQSSQVELLVVYGADPGAYDSNGKTPIEHAKAEGNLDLADRLLECQYELTDRLATYLCNRRPDHRNGQHFIIPELSDSSLDMSELAKAAKKKLQALPNHLFEELAMDAYDEVDRRENNTTWLQSQPDSTLVTDRQTIPFLPVNPEFSSTRNQGRQKLARFNAREFATLIIDILSDARRRQLGLSAATSTLTTNKEKGRHRHGNRNDGKSNSFSDDEPLYDSVCSDEDYASIGDNQSLKEEQKPPKKDKSLESMASSDQSDAGVPLDDYTDVKRSLNESQARVHQLVQTNRDLKQEINILQNMVQKLVSENQTLKTSDAPQQNGDSPKHTARHDPTRTQSMYEPRELKQSPALAKTNEPIAQNAMKVKVELEPKPQTAQISNSGHHQLPLMSSDYENMSDQNTGAAAVTVITERSTSQRSSGQSSHSQNASTPGSSCSQHSLELSGATAYSDGTLLEPPLPTQDDVVRKTERITKKIQELLICAQEGKYKNYTSCSGKIHGAVQDMVQIFPHSLTNDQMKDALLLLTSGSKQLRENCKPSALEQASADPRLHTQQVIQCAYNIAKAAKQLVILFE